MSDFSIPIMETCRRLPGFYPCYSNNPPSHNAKAYNEQLVKLQEEAINKPSHGKSSHGNSFLQLMDQEELQEESTGKSSHGNSFLQPMDLNPQEELQEKARRIVSCGKSSRGYSFLQRIDREPQVSEDCVGRTRCFDTFDKNTLAESQGKRVHKKPEKKHNVEQEKGFEVIELHEEEEDDDLVIVDKIDGIEDDYVEV